MELVIANGLDKAIKDAVELDRSSKLWLGLTDDARERYGVEQVLIIITPIRKEDNAYPVERPTILGSSSREGQKPN